MTKIEIFKPGDMVKIRSDHTVNGGAVGIVSGKWRDCWVVEWLTGEWAGFEYTVHPRFMAKSYEGK